MKAATALISTLLLEKYLGLDKIGIRIQRVRQSWEQEGRVFEMLLEGDGLKEVQEGQMYPTVTVILSRDKPTEIEQ